MRGWDEYFVTFSQFTDEIPKKPYLIPMVKSIIVKYTYLPQKPARLTDLRIVTLRIL